MDCWTVGLIVMAILFICGALEDIAKAIQKKKY